MANHAPAGRHEPWQLEGSAAELYQRHLVPAMTAHWAVDLVQRVDVRSSDRVLDVACGTGVVARAAADRLGQAGRVAGIDINAGMLAVARSLSGGQRDRIAWLGASSLALPVPDASQDVVLCQLGLQFFADRPAALAEIHRVAQAWRQAWRHCVRPHRAQPGDVRAISGPRSPDRA